MGILEITKELLLQIHAHGAATYPEEGAGFLLGTANGEHKLVSAILPLNNAREDAARHNRYLLAAQDYLRGEQEAARQGLDVLGVFHSHPDHPNHPSEFDREWAMPWFSYLITSVQAGQAVESRSWRLADDRSQFIEEAITTPGVIMSASLQPIDQSAMQVSQISIVLLNILAFLLNAPWLAAVVTAAMLLGTLLKMPGFGFVYRYALKPLGWVKPHILQDNPEPHRFSQGLGGAFMLAGSLLLWLGQPAIGWGLVWLVAALAALNAFGGFCAGCFIYYWLGRLHVPGFTKTPPAGAFPGMRPAASKSNDAS
jgi:proteasome lid subunit RPN8/RPN11